MDTQTGLIGTNMFAYCNNNSVTFIDDGNTPKSYSDAIKYYNYKGPTNIGSGHLKKIQYVSQTINGVVNKGFDITIVPIATDISSSGINFIERHEALGKRIYADPKGNPTIGFGHLITSKELQNGTFNKYKCYRSGSGGQDMSVSDATKLLNSDLHSSSGIVTVVNNKITNAHALLSQREYDALIDYAFQWGPNRDSISKIINYLNYPDYDDYKSLINSGDNYLYKNRRTDEYNLAVYGSYGYGNIPIASTSQYIKY